ncbi:SUMO E3 ligase Pli1 [Schizosaccharomyces japonicus yFS275]|uniref:SUMO E3 ligase Pli1 n=1 Tax=Schizosaccharomyces japonicus (strain yFS275 / FY16936) TaxID=402676 RepID=B6JWF1_SCHJY|nr:SUMO E3 ligase Pli1 [Schizosaccharomyces japonicus yFS275]EEB05702.1 SUMO E3 ligase Pli1 [Schizosaccharomyces japonicus yFS275]
MEQASFLRELPSVLKRIETGLIVAQLKNVLRIFCLRLSGTKQELINRIKQFIEKITLENDMVSWEALKKAVNGDIAGATQILRPQFPNPVAYPTSVQAPRPSIVTFRPYPQPLPHVAPTRTRLKFKSSPFYDVLESFNAPFPIPPCVNARNTVNFCFQLTPAAISKLATDANKRYRIYFFSTATETIGLGECLMEYPTPQMELRINHKVVPASFRGLKGKVGTCNPADITDYVNSYAGAPGNNVTIHYMNANKAFTALVSLVQTWSVDQLMQRIKTGRKESKEKIVERIKRDNDDADLIATSVDVSLKCPLSFTRISVPIRSIFCKHIQCFDALAFLQLNKQMPSWSCPVCNTTVRYYDLIIDGYLEDILANTPPNAESVTVDPEGKWTLNAFDDDDESSENETPAKEDVVDLSDIDEPTVTPSLSNGSAALTAAAEHHSGSQQIPAKRLPSVSSHSHHSSSHNPPKRKRESIIIDLTISDDDEDNAAADTLSSMSSSIHTPRREDAGSTNGPVAKVQKTIPEPPQQQQPPPPSSRAFIHDGQDHAGSELPLPPLDNASALGVPQSIFVTANNETLKTNDQFLFNTPSPASSTASPFQLHPALQHQIATYSPNNSPNMASNNGLPTVAHELSSSPDHRGDKSHALAVQQQQTDNTLAYNGPLIPGLNLAATSQNVKPPSNSVNSNLTNLLQREYLSNQLMRIPDYSLNSSTPSNTEGIHKIDNGLMQPEATTSVSSTAATTDTTNSHPENPSSPSAGPIWDEQKDDQIDWERELNIPLFFNSS